MEIIEQSRAEYYKNKISEELKNIENKNSFDSNALASILEEMELDIDVNETEYEIYCYFHLLSYLALMDLVSFKLLFKRIHIKLDPKIILIHTLAQKIWDKEFGILSQIKELANFGIPLFFCEFLFEKITNEIILQISNSFENISLTRFKNFLGLDDKEAIEIIEKFNFKLKGEFVEIPEKMNLDGKRTEKILAEQLNHMTEIITIIEKTS